MGAAVWGAYWIAEDWLEGWLATAGWSVPMIIVPLALVMVNQHPVPVDDCPCFEDAIAFVSVALGSLLGRWFSMRYGFGPDFFSDSMPGSHGLGLADRTMWWGVATLKMVFGVFIIFSWRLFAKATLHFILPPTYRFLAQAFTLPTRRFYTPATDYKNVPSDLGLRPIPSVIDLPEHLGMEMETDIGTHASGLGLGYSAADLRARGGKANGSKMATSKGFGTVYGVGNGDRNWELEKHGNGEVKGDVDDVKHYDADVLTKVVVYCGIALLASTGLPVFFEVVGWGVKSW